MKVFLIASLFFLFFFRGPGFFSLAAAPIVDSEIKERAAPREVAVETNIKGSPQPVMVFLGDNVTAGTSAKILDLESPELSFPAVLQEKMNVTVINSGFKWATAAIALGHIENAVFQHEPDMVVINLGLIDFLTKTPPRETGDNLQTLITALDNGTRKIFLVRFYDEYILRANMNHMGLREQEQLNLLSEYNGIFRNLSARNNIELITGIWEGLDYGYNIASDFLNPTAEGHQVMAANIFKFLEPELKTKNLLK